MLDVAVTLTTILLLGFQSIWILSIEHVCVRFVLLMFWWTELGSNRWYTWNETWNSLPPNLSFYLYFHSDYVTWHDFFLSFSFSLTQSKVRFQWLIQTLPNHRVAMGNCTEMCWVMIAKWIIMPLINGKLWFASIVILSRFFISLVLLLWLTWGLVGM